MQKNSTDWNTYYTLLCDYYRKNNTSSVPNHYEINGCKLGLWVYRQRNKYKLNKLSEDRINCLNEVHMIWDAFEASWQLMYKQAENYVQEYGNLLVPARYITPTGEELGAWLCTQRRSYMRQGSRAISQERITLLENLGMSWNANYDFWMSYYMAAKLFYTKFGHLYIPVKYVYNGLKLGKWVSRQRSNYQKALKNNTLDTIQKEVQKLEEIGMDWNVNTQKNTSFGEQALYYYLKKCFVETENRDMTYGCEIDVLIPSLNFGIEYDGYMGHKDVKKDILKIDKCTKQGLTILNIRDSKCEMLPKRYNSYTLKNDSVLELESAIRYILSFIEKEYLLSISLDIDIVRDSTEIMDMYLIVCSCQWEKMYLLAKTYFEETGDLLIPAMYETEKGDKLGGWLRRQRQGYTCTNGNRLSKRQIEKLNDIHMVWNVNEKVWVDNYNRVKQILHDNKTSIRKVSIPLYKWWRGQIKKLGLGKLSVEKSVLVGELV